MINQQLLNPHSIAVIGGSNNIHKPGGKILKNILTGGFQGKVYVVNSKKTQITGVTCFFDISQLPDIDLAILSIPAKSCPDAVDLLALKKHTRAFIIISAGFSEVSHEGFELEKLIVDRVNSVEGCLIGPNCIGILAAKHHSLIASLRHPSRELIRRGATSYPVPGEQL